VDGGRKNEQRKILITIIAVRGAESCEKFLGISRKFKIIIIIKIIQRYGMVWSNYPPLENIHRMIKTLLLLRLLLSLNQLEGDMEKVNIQTSW
jgi:hypothetical protein